LALLDDGGRQLEPDHLRFRLTGDTKDVRHRLLQKADGHFWLALWVERPGWDPAPGQEPAAAGPHVRVARRPPVPGAGGGLAPLGLEGTDQAQLVELLPPGANGTASRATTPPEAPTQDATTQAPVVRGGGQPATPPTPRAADPAH